MCIRIYKGDMTENHKIEERQVRFSKELLIFYKELVGGIAPAIRTLAEIQENFPKEFDKFRGVKGSPSMTIGIVDKAPTEVKEDLLLMLYKSSELGNKIDNLFSLSLADKKQLAKDLKRLSEDK